MKPFLTFAVWMTALSAICSPAGEPSHEGLARIYLIRGMGGLIPFLENSVKHQFESKGLEVESFKFPQRAKATREISRAYHAGELKEGVILVGYSLGGCSVLRVCRNLEKQGVPVKMLFLVEPANPFQTVPSNVEECFNFYHYPALVGQAVKADSDETFLVNCEAYSQAGFGVEYTHFVIPFFERLHDLIATEVVEAIKEEAPGGGSERLFHIALPRAKPVE